MVAPALATRSTFFVDVDANPGINYGASVRRSAELGRFPSAENSGVMEVQTKVDTDAFYRLIVQRLGR